MTDIVYFSVVPSPLGELTLTASADALTGLYLPNAKHARVAQPSWLRDDARLRPVAAQLGEYFAGMRTRFDVRMAAEGTPFQRRVWQALLAIPFGQTRSYGELARALGMPSASRAVGAANGRNPISILVPCHRVVGGDGSLTGYAGGLSQKRTLLALEQAGQAGTKTAAIAAF